MRRTTADSASLMVRSPRIARHHPRIAWRPNNRSTARRPTCRPRRGHADSPRLVREVLQEQGVHRALQPDVHYRRRRQCERLRRGNGQRERLCRCPDHQSDAWTGVKSSQTAASAYGRFFGRADNSMRPRSRLRSSARYERRPPLRSRTILAQRRPKFPGSAYRYECPCGLNIFSGGVSASDGRQDWRHRGRQTRQFRHAWEGSNDVPERPNLEYSCLANDRWWN